MGIPYNTASFLHVTHFCEPSKSYVEIDVSVRSISEPSINQETTHPLSIIWFTQNRESKSFSFDSLPSSLHLIDSLSGGKSQFDRHCLLKLPYCLYFDFHDLKKNGNRFVWVSSGDLGVRFGCCHQQLEPDICFCSSVLQEFWKICRGLGYSRKLHEPLQQLVCSSQSSTFWRF